MPQLRFPARDGTSLCGRLTLPDDPHGGVVVLCHPHPRHGGSMEAWMLSFLQRALVADGWTGLRFDFRGVGTSDGSFDHGRGEQRIEELVEAAADPVELVAIEGGDHYLADRRDELGGAVRAFARRLRAD